MWDPPCAIYPSSHLRPDVGPFSCDAGYPEAWVTTAEKKLRGAKVESLERKTPEGITLKPLYSAADLDRCEAVADPERDAPGLYPYHRGPYATMYTSRPWTVRQYAGFSTAEESNAFYRRNLAAGELSR